MRILSAGTTAERGPRPALPLLLRRSKARPCKNPRPGFWLRPRRLLWEEMLAVLALCFFAVQGAVPGIAPAQALATNLAAATGLMRIGGMAAQALIYGGILLLLYRARHKIRPKLPGLSLVLVFTLWVLATAIWSLDPVLTLRRGVEFALAGGFGVYLAVRYSLQKQLRIFWLAMLLLALGSLVTIYFFPAIGLDRSAGHLHDWKGVFTQKNASGRMMVLATALLLGLRRRFASKRMVFCSAWSASMALFLLLLFKSGSRSAWLLELAVLAGSLAVWMLRKTALRFRALLLLMVASSGLFVALALYAERVRLLAELGRGVMLSGRVGIWAAVWSFICQRPWLGWGYAAFWQGWTGPSFAVSSMVHFLVFHAHDGYLDLWLQTGLVGLLLFTLIAVQAAGRLAACAARGRWSGLTWPLSVLMIVALYGVDENTIMIVHGIFWPLVVMALVLLGGKRASRHELRQRSTSLHVTKGGDRGLLLDRRSYAARALSSRRVAPTQ